MVASRQRRLQLVEWASAPAARPRAAQKPSSRSRRARLTEVEAIVATDTESAAIDADAGGAPRDLRRAEREITALRREIELLRSLVHVDHLTGTLNRCGLNPTFEREAARADRHNSPLGIALLDIDDFKMIGTMKRNVVGPVEP
jgi:diguanylate cyclase